MKHLEFGNAVHEAIGNIYDQYDKETAWKLSDKKLAKRAFSKKFTIDSLDPGELNMKGELVYTTEANRAKGFEEMRDDGLSIIDSYWNEKEVLLAEHGVNPVRLEVPIKMPVKNLITGEPFEIPLSCRIDGVNEDGSVVELKTSKAKYDERDTRKSPQALIYTLAGFLMTGKILPLTYVVMLKGRVRDDRIQILRYEYEEADLLSFMTRIESFIEGVRLKRFDRPTRDHPRFCDCDKFSSMIEGL